jgi:hypothetical protein
MVNQKMMSGCRTRELRKVVIEILDVLGVEGNR